VKASSAGWTSSVTLACLAGALALSGMFVVVEQRLTNPLIPPRILRSRNLACVGLVRGLFCFGSYGTFFLCVLYLQQVLKFGAVGNGLAFLPNTIFISGLALFATPWLIGRAGAKPIQALGLAVFAVGVLLLVTVPVHGHYFANVFPSMAVMGVASGLFNVPNVTLAMAESASEDSGIVSGVINVSQQLGAAMGVAVMASVSAARTRTLIAHGRGAASAVVAGFHTGFLIGAISVVASVGVALLVQPARHRRAAADAAAGTDGAGGADGAISRRRAAGLAYRRS
jgi:predicted MFS family arabinose efflux permease